MKFLLVALTLGCSSAFAYSPSFTSTEVKISYPCGSESQLQLEKEEKELITFFDGNGNPLYKNGLVLRKRTSSGGRDFTVKYRAGGGQINFDKNLFDKLSVDQTGKLKCEIDMVYGGKAPSKAFQSCSFKTDEPAMTSSHLDFIKMTKSEPVLTNLKEFKIESTAWKIKLNADQKISNPFPKKPSAEKWEVRGECKLEVSGKFDITGLSEAEILSQVEKGFSFIKGLVPAEPSIVQGNKTSWALGL